MAMPIYMKITGAVQGDITGACTRAGHEGHTELESLSHLVGVPHDASRGHHLGRRVHNPVKITKMVDVSTTALYSAMINHEMLTIELIWYRQEKTTAKEEQYFTTTLEQATIISVEAKMFDQFVPANKAVPHLEEVAFAYEGIRWNYIPDSLEVTDHHDAAAT